MRGLRSLALSAGAAALAVSLLGAMGSRTSDIKVMRCEPQRGNTFVSGGYVPGYYPAYPYYWNNVYGARYYQPQVTRTSPKLAIDYVNDGSKVAATIEFGLVANRRLIAEVRDVGTFSPGAEIKHEFGLSSNVFPIGTGMAQCVPLKITYKDGSKWRNPHLPALRRSAH